ncbi:MAG: alpha-2-macroglobulin, partial [Rhodospirillales bacterium]|nr:alpha-2-macroglobulin [Rhodospirillales bacterium]
FRFSSDPRFSGNQPFRSTPVLERESRTDDHGAASITLNPAIEPTAQPRKYVIEATVIGDDDRTVTNTQEIAALPPFVLGLKVPRFLERVQAIEPEVIVADAQGVPLAGQNVTVRLFKRQWNSILQATDFSQGQAKYVTEVIEDKVAETQVTSAADPVTVPFPIAGSGVYVVEIESQDKLGRSQTVSLDLFAGGETPMTWARPPAEVFTVTTEKESHAPGETARLVLQSPFQNAEALAIVEEPDGHNSYSWVPVRNGYGTFPLPVRADHLPRVPVHFVLMRGRLPGDDEAVTTHADLRKPASLAATQWVTVTPVKNMAKVELLYPKKAQPGDEVDITVKLSDDQGQPLAGEVTLWMVDQAILALAREAKLDPLPQFIVERKSRLTLRDSRNMAFGLLPLQEEPGGDEGDIEAGDQRVTVRKNFTPVPYYEPNLMVGPEGQVTVKVRLPDSLTNFKLRAKAISGAERFGF